MPDLYLSSEGRQFLRGLYPIYKGNVGLTDGDVAILMVSGGSTRAPQNKKAEEKQKRQVSAVRSALKRWESYPYDDAEKNLYKPQKRNAAALAVLERIMTNDPMSAEMMASQVAGTRKMALAEAFGSFFFGRHGELAKELGAAATRERIEGLHQIIEVSHVKQGDHHEPGMTTARWNGYYIYFVTDPKIAGMIVHIFGVRLPASDHAMVLHNRESGFAFPVATGEVHCMVAQHEPPLRRSYMAWVPTSLDQLGIWGPYRKIGDLGYQYYRAPEKDALKRYTDNDNRFEDSGAYVLRRADKMTERVLLSLINRLKWNVEL